MSKESFNKELLNKEYAVYKEKAFHCYNKNKLHRSLKYIEYCGLIAWFYPILDQFSDDELESLLKKIKSKLYPLTLPEKIYKNRIVFYNSQIIDSGALTEQYLSYLIKNQYEILLIIPNKNNTKLGNNILAQIKSNPSITLFIPNTDDLCEKIIIIEKEILKFGPSRAFLHFTPADIVGFASFCNLTTIKKYYIVHNDHTFWFGKACSDYFIEFRKFGYLLSIQRRGIPVSNIYLLPYYPIKQSIPFQGFPFDTNGKIIGFSGANLYKYYLDPELKFFYAIKDLLIRNPEFVFCLAGSGNFEPIERFIIENKLQDRFFLLGKRYDFYELIRNIDILFESYPQKGGLTVLYGTENHKAITGIGNDLNASGCIEDFFDLREYKQPQKIDDFIVEAESLIKSEKNRIINAKKFEFNRFNKVDFEAGLNKIFNGILPTDQPIYDERLKLDDEYYLEEYLKLPDDEFLFYNRKLFHFKALINLSERLVLFINIVKLKPQVLKQRLARYIFLTIVGK